MKIRNHNVSRHAVAWIAAAMLMLTSCNSENDFAGSDSTSPSASAQDAVTFTTTVSSMRQATRADATIVNKGETMLLPTATTKRKVGIFGCYTGPYTWAELVGLSLKNSPTVAEKEILDKYYTANQMFNVPATIEEDNSLTYLPLQFWSNNPLPSGTGHEYMTFWAYYPYNASSTLGEYGISMYNDENGVGVGKGMGKVKFTMHADAAQHNDFLISAPVTDCNRDKYMLLRTDNTPTYAPKPVQFRLFHMLAQVRFYVYIRGDDKMEYEKDGEGNDKVVDATWFDSWAVDGTIMDAWGNVYTKRGDDAVERTTQKAAFPTEFATNLTKEKFLALGLKVPDETKCVRWERTGVWDLNHARRRANITYELQLNNIRTTAEFHPHYYYPYSDAVSIDFDNPPILGSVTVNNYIMNPYWFTFQNGQRVRLNDNYMFDYFEDTPVANSLNATATMTGYDDIDGVDWRTASEVDPISYLRLMSDEGKKEIESISDNAWIDNNDHTLGHKHYNYAPGNILLVVPQKLEDEVVPHVIITATGKRAVWNSSKGKWEEGKDLLTAKVTVNMLKMGISWESGYIYCYAFLDDLKPGDDKVRGPESITVLFNKDWYTDQW